VGIQRRKKRKKEREREISPYLCTQNNSPLIICAPIKSLFFWTEDT
jgi:hypothetical protein